MYAAPGTTPATLIDIAREFSPRIEPYEPLEIAIDLSGLTRLFGTAHEIGHELRRTAADRGVRVRVAIAGTRTAARLIVRHRVGVTVIEPGTETDAVAPLPIALLDAIAKHVSNPPSPRSAKASRGFGEAGSNEFVMTLRRWGLRTLGEFAALAPDDVAARLGQDGIAWQRVACGQDAQPLVPAVAEEPFEQALDLEWPIDDLEPLSFVLGRLLEPLSARLERRDCGAAVLHIRLRLVTRAVHERSLQLPAPMRDARTLRTLALLDLESHPPEAAIDRVVVAIEPTPGRVLQFSLLTRPLPSPEQVSTLMARLSALMGEERCGSPMDVDSWQPGAFAMKPFAPRDCESQTIPDASMTAAAQPVVALRRFRFPVPARVRVEDGRPVRVTTDRPGLSGGRVQTGAGPWRTSGQWWSEAGDVWNRDEWDVALSDGATYRVFREREADRWFVEGIVD
jgi:protein ImuB